MTGSSETASLRAGYALAADPVLWAFHDGAPWPAPRR
jgi:hypothetical protein